MPKRTSLSFSSQENTYDSQSPKTSSLWSYQLPCMYIILALYIMHWMCCKFPACLLLVFILLFRSYSKRLLHCICKELQRVSWCCCFLHLLLHLYHCLKCIYLLWPFCVFIFLCFIVWCFNCFVFPISRIF